MDKKMTGIVAKLREATQSGCKFISFLYTTKGTGETSRYTINFGIDYRSAVDTDKALLEAYVPTSDLEVVAKEEMLQSMNETLVFGVSSSYTNVDTYDHIGTGIRQHREDGNIHLSGFVQQKEQVAPPTNPKKPVNSRPLTLAKKSIRKACDFKRERFGQFIISPDHIAGIKVCGDLIEIQN
jgi:hypothetical protein